MLKSIKAISVTVLLVLFVVLISLFAGCKFNSCDSCKEIECCYCKYGLKCENLSSEWHKKYFESLNYEEINQAKNMVQKIRESYIDEVLIEDNKKIYTIIKFIKGKRKYSKKELYFGPILL